MASLHDLIAGRTEKATPTGTDKLPLLDSADANKFRWLSWSGLVARLVPLFEAAGAASSAVSAHAAAADPHPSYTTAAEAAAAAPVQSVAGKVGQVTLAISDVATLQAALDGKAASGHNQTASTISDFAEAVDDRVASLLVAGANVTLTYSDAGNALTVAASGGGSYTDEQAQDAVGSILADSGTVDFAYDDAAGTITAAAKTQMSIAADAAGLKLVGDSAAPGSNRLYGTDAAGTKGWHPQPAAPRVVTGAIVGNAVTIDAAGASDVVVNLVLTDNVNNIAFQGLPAGVCRMTWRVTQGAGGPYAFPVTAWPNTVASSYYIYPDSTPTMLWWTTLDGGASATLETNSPNTISRAPAIAAGAIVVDAAGIADVAANLTLSANVASISHQSVPTRCRIRYKVVQSDGPWTIASSAWPAGTVVEPFYLAPVGTTILEWETADGGASARVRGPTAGAENALYAPGNLVKPLTPFIKLSAGRYFDQAALAAASGTLAGAAGRLDLVGFCREFDVAIDLAGLNVTTAVAGALGRIAIYGATATGTPGSLLLLSNDIDLSAVGYASQAISFTFAKGAMYFVGYLSSSTATVSAIQGFTLPAFGLASGTSTAPLSCIRQVVTYPNAPADFAFSAATHLATSAAPSVRMRVA